MRDRVEVAGQTLVQHGVGEGSSLSTSDGWGHIPRNIGVLQGNLSIVQHGIPGHQ